VPRRLAAPVKIGITGLPGSGKTQTLLRIIQLLEQEDAVFAHEKLKSRIRSGRYGVNLAALEDLGARALKEAREGADVIVIDEVGKMEVESELFTKSVVDTLDTNKSIVMTLHKKSRNPLLQDIRRRDELRLLEVTPVNKNLLAFKIVHLLTGRAH
jgi:nucleoside-triphosphatase